MKYLILITLLGCSISHKDKTLDRLNEGDCVTHVWNLPIEAWEVKDIFIYKVVQFGINKVLLSSAAGHSSRSYDTMEILYIRVDCTLGE